MTAATEAPRTLEPGTRTRADASRPPPQRERVWVHPIPESPLAIALVGLGLAVLYAVGASLPFWFLTSPDAGAAFFPPAGLTLALLVLTPPRMWPVWLAIVAGTELAVDLYHGLSASLALGFALANAVEPLLGALALDQLMGGNLARPRRLFLCFMATAVVLGPAVGGFLGGATAVLFGTASSVFSVGAKWWLGDAIGVLVVATPILAWSIRTRVTGTTGVLEMAAFTVVATAITILPALLWHHPLVYAVLPVLMFAGFRGGVRAVSTAGVGVAFAADWAAVTGRTTELLPAATADDQLLYIQVFIVITLVAALVLAVEVVERRQTESKVRRVEAERILAEQRAALAAAVERRRIAQDTHDIVGHGLNVMLLQAGAARRVLDSDPDLTRELLMSIEGVGRAACRDLDLALKVTEASDGRDAGRGLSSLPGLIAVLRATGLYVTLHVEGDEGGVSTLVDWSAYRIVQEALTNVAKHAPSAHVAVTVCYEADELVLVVVDDGVGDVPGRRPGGEGRGVIGMRERAQALGGTLFAGNLDGGFVVNARLPARAGQA